MTSALAKQAAAHFDDGFSCAQSIFMAYSQLFAIDPKDAACLARGFGGGLAHLGQTCGAVSGAALLLGLTIKGADEQQNKKAAYAVIKEFADRFEAAHGSINCRQLLGCDLGTPEGMNKFKETGMKHSQCQKYIATAAEIIEDLLKIEQK